MRITDITYDEVKNSAQYLINRGVVNAEVAVILGTGLDSFVNSMHVELEIPYPDIPHFPIPTMEYHSGRLVYGTLSGKKVLVMKGRFHAYEGYSKAQISFPVRVFSMLGVKKLLISNAAGSVNPVYKKGDIMLFDDHLNLQEGSPLTGLTDSRFGGRFVDLSTPYDLELNDQLTAIARAEGITLHKGVYCCVAGPHLETRAEYRFIRMIGCDAVGMSTVPEVIVANQVGLPCAAISVITDECDPENLQPVNIDDIISTANAAEPKLNTLFSKLIAAL